jgi:type IV pilus assembly protein PilW
MLRVRQQFGFSLVELMIAITLGMLVMISLVTAFVNSSRTRDEVERASQQIENGRYAMQVLGTDLWLAGYWAEFNVAGANLANPASKPDPCATALTDLSAALPTHIQGYDQGAVLSCLSDVKANTDIVVVRRASTCVRGSTDCPATTPPSSARLQRRISSASIALSPISIGTRRIALRSRTHISS